MLAAKWFKWKSRLKLRIKYRWNNTLSVALQHTFGPIEPYTSKDGKQYAVAVIPEDEIPSLFGVQRNEPFVMVCYNENPEKEPSFIDIVMPKQYPDTQPGVCIILTQYTLTKIKSEVLTALYEHEIGHVVLGHMEGNAHVDSLQKEKEADMYAAEQTHRVHVLEYLTELLKIKYCNTDDLQERWDYIFNNCYTTERSKE